MMFRWLLLGLLLAGSVETVAMAQQATQTPAAAEDRRTPGRPVRPTPTPTPTPAPIPEFRVSAYATKTRYEPGERIEVTVQSQLDSYIYVFVQEARGPVRQIFPNYFEPNNRIPPNQRVTVPGSRVTYSSQREGNHTIYVFAVDASAGRYTKPLDHYRADRQNPFPEIPGTLEQISQELRRSVSAENNRPRRPEPRQGFTVNVNPSGSSTTFGRYPSQPAPSQQLRRFGEASASFQVYTRNVRPPSIQPPSHWRPPRPPNVPADQLGSLIVTTTPVRADVFIDSYYYGRTPLTYEMPAGVYTVEMFSPGYEPYRTSLRVTARQRRTISARLQPERVN